MKLLGLDISTKTGFAVINDEALSDYGLIKSKIDASDDFSYLDKALDLGNSIGALIEKHRPDKIIIEQTNQGRFRTQKLLEFIHMAVLLRISALNLRSRVQYIDTSRWRSILKIRLTKEQRLHNKAVKQKLARGKITSKHLAVLWVNNKFGMKLKLKDNDIADAICLCCAINETKKPTSSSASIEAALGIRK